ncbi:aminodeoxychorismate synthase component I [Paracoccus sp. CPCC 101403]|uniref:Aminodeoxychorismate synthase component I n=1 Tax=Paracoccus broussonetiae TaxID=3075834 RepID=A0ABU3EJG7_9RHOB|nr:aminodeoxychorismate synthase component I [Paracoccus sp. CPCC 101403]MDT1064255.1 aminodeoxychorismate synthase component I [Paracoccus sp. CPCC 101403]
MILVENGPEGRPAIFRDADRLILAETPDEVLPALEELDRAHAEGAWIAGWAGYEAGMALESRLRPLLRQPQDEPLLAFGVYRQPLSAREFHTQADAQAAGVRIAPFQPLIGQQEYRASFARLADYIAQGDCYQVNLTFPMQGQLLQGSAAGLYGALARVQPVGHGAFVDLGRGPAILSRSPELFFALDADGMIETRPMKGTAPRDPDPARDHALARALAADEKTRAENLMIVDLLRNDIARIARVGSVRVTELFHVQTLRTVHQMTSRIIGQLSERPRLSALMQALFPCGSVTGAPKIRAMEIIAELEPHARSVYCGSIGWMAPDGRAAFNVAIRTLRLFDDGRLMVNVGGGVIHDSTADGEWEEALWKARFADPARICG